MLVTNATPPSPQTLKKYGLSLKDWQQFFNKQKGVCCICEEPRRLVIDHFHIRNWKKMTPDKRKLYVRGLLCVWCNFRVLRKGITVQKLRNALNYMEEFERKLNANH